MEKCRICLKLCRNMCPIDDKKDGISFADMVTCLTKIKLIVENNLPGKICATCCKKLTEAYNFKICIERSEIALNQSANIKKFNFNNIDDIKLEIDSKPITEPLKRKFTENLINGNQIITYNDTVIKKLQRICDKTEITVPEFLNSVKVESDIDNNDKFYDDVDYEPISDHNYKEQLKYKKEIKKKQSNVIDTSNKDNNQNIYFDKPIRPISLKDVIIRHKDYIDKSKRYIYPAKTSICPYCGKVLRSSYIRTHILKHTSNELFKCDICLRSYPLKKLLVNHIKKHAQTNTFKCNMCVATFSNKIILNSHMLVHVGEKKYICKICHRGFKRKSTLKRHELIHSFGKAIQCELCPMTFHTNQNLNHHMRVHTGERPYKCELCSQPYSYKHDFNRHCLKKHGVMLKRRLVNIMNEEVLQQERALMRDVALRAHGIVEGVPSVYESPMGALALAHAIKAIETRQVSVSFLDTTQVL